MDGTQVNVNSYGYIWSGREIEVLIQPHDFSSRSAFTDDIVKSSLFTWQQQYDSWTETKDLLSPHVEQVFFIACPNQGVAWRNFLSQVKPRKVLVPSWDMISTSPQILQAKLSEAVAENILIVSLKESALLKLEIEVALTLFNQWVMIPLVESVASSNETSNYETLRDLIREGLTGDQICERMNISRSTLFRLKRESNERLAEDIESYAFAQQQKQSRKGS